MNEVDNLMMALQIIYEETFSPGAEPILMVDQAHYDRLAAFASATGKPHITLAGVRIMPRVE